MLKIAEETPSIRASSVPRILACPQSRHEPRLKIDQDSTPARVGNAVHEMMDRYISNGEIFDNENIEKCSHCFVGETMRVGNTFNRVIHSVEIGSWFFSLFGCFLFFRWRKNCQTKINDYQYGYN